LKKLKKRWNIETNWELFVIFLVFAITGSSATKFATPITEFIGINREMGGFVYWSIRILIIFPVYQLLLVFYGWLFGEFEFFWKFEKKMIRNLKLGFLLNDN
jgi:hypothetical protein